MKPIRIVMIVVAIALVIATCYTIFNRVKNLKNERAWFAKNAGYEFSARTDSIMMRDNATVGIGKILASVTGGIMRPRVEDSLRKHLEEHSRLWFNNSKRVGAVAFTAPIAGNCLVNDSLVVSSSRDKILVYRGKNKVAEESLSNMLEGNPFK